MADDEVVQEYLAECREHLSGIESDLLQMEQDGAQIDDERVNKVFRAAHSIKGGAGFFNFNKIRDLAHKTENVLDLIRSRRAVASPEVVNILLLAFDKLREMIDDPAASEQADISEFVRGLQDLTAAGVAAESKENVNVDISVAAPGRPARLRMTGFDFDTALKTGRSVYLAAYDLLNDIHRKGKHPLEVLKNLMAYGSLLDTAFDLSSAGTLEDSASKELYLEVLYATCLDTDLIGSVVEVPQARIWKVDRHGVCRAVVFETPAAEAAQTEPQPHENDAASPAAHAAAPRPGAGATAPTSAAADNTVRLHVTLLDSLMNLAGELVLCRNQLSDAVARGDQAMVETASQSIGLVTSDVQQAVMRTRMQPVANLFQKFTRFVRDSGRTLKKDVRLVIEANEVELDKTIIEGLSDPLSHMVRNAVDHGIEAPAARTAAGKPSEGTVYLRAWHEAGLVVVEVADDGKGLDPAKLASSAVSKGLISAEAAASMTREEKLDLILLAGFSTAERVSDLSGRGVGMDVVKTNMDRLGGKLEIRSEIGAGSSFRIKLPLTLAIIPSLLVSAGEDRVAVPLVNVQKLIRIDAADAASRIQCVGSTRVLVLEDALVPLVDLAGALEITTDVEKRDGRGEATNIVLVGGVAFRYGLVVARLHETMEIVVKPLGRRLKHLQQYAGATILGDGCVALILDVAGVAAVAGLAPESGAAAHNAEAAGQQAETHRLLMVQNSATEPCALPLHVVARVEKIRPEQVEFVGGRRSMQYRGRSLPLITLADSARVAELALDDNLVVVVLELSGQSLGLLAARPVDVVEADVEIDSSTLRQTGVMGSAIIRERTTLILDAFELADSVRREGESAGREETPQAQDSAGATVLFAEDSTFFREHTSKLLREAGYKVLAAPDGEEAWEILNQRSGEIQAVLTDVEMPRLDGLEFTRRIRGDGRFARLPIVMLTSLAGEDDVRRGQMAGATTYCIKLDRDQLLETMREVLAGIRKRGDDSGLAELSRSVLDASEEIPR